MRVLVTGGAGFIGSHLVERLVSEGESVTVVDDLSNGTVENLKNVKGVPIDVFDVSSGPPFGEYDVIYHLACYPRSMSFTNPERDIEVNVIGMVNVLECARRNNALVIFSSNSGIYDTSEIPITEETQDSPKSPYDLDKLTAEGYLRLYSYLYDVPYVIFRFATVYGPRQKVSRDWKPVVMTFIDNVLNGRHCEVHGDGQQTRDFIYVSDVVDALLLARKNKKVLGNIMILGTGIEMSIWTLLKTICGVAGVGMNFVEGPENIGDIRRMCYLSEKTKDILGWEASIDLEGGIKKIMEWKKSV